MPPQSSPYRGSRAGGGGGGGGGGGFQAVLVQTLTELASLTDVFAPSPGSSVVVTVVCSVLLFLVGLVGGFAAGTLVGYCCARKPHPPGPSLPAPLYEDVEITTTHRQTQQELKIEDNVAYGHFK